jgi:hypothetical protein
LRFVRIAPPPPAPLLLPPPEAAKDASEPVKGRVELALEPARCTNLKRDKQERERKRTTR